MAASSLCAIHASFLQQNMLNAQVSALIAQAKCRRFLKTMAALVLYPSPSRDITLPISILVFSDVGRLFEHRKLFCFAGLPDNHVDRILFIPYCLCRVARLCFLLNPLAREKFLTYLQL